MWRVVCLVIFLFTFCNVCFCEGDKENKNVSQQPFRIFRLLLPGTVKSSTNKNQDDSSKVPMSEIIDYIKHGPNVNHDDDDDDDDHVYDIVPVTFPLAQTQKKNNGRFTSLSLPPAERRSYPFYHPVDHLVNAAVPFALKPAIIADALLATKIAATKLAAIGGLSAAIATAQVAALVGTAAAAAGAVGAVGAVKGAGVAKGVAAKIVKDKVLHKIKDKAVAHYLLHHHHPHHHYPHYHHHQGLGWGHVHTPILGAAPYALGHHLAAAPLQHHIFGLPGRLFG